MNTAAPARSKAVISLLILAMIAMCSTAAHLRQEGCAGDLIAFSPCLPYVSSPPNNETASASSQCCSVFSSAFESTDGACLCYLLRQPLILGFPLNATKLLGLPSVCPPGNATSARNASLETFCSGFLGSWTYLFFFFVFFYSVTKFWNLLKKTIWNFDRGKLKEISRNIENIFFFFSFLFLSNFLKANHSNQIF